MSKTACSQPPICEKSLLCFSSVVHYLVFLKLDSSLQYRSTLRAHETQATFGTVTFPPGGGARKLSPRMDRRGTAISMMHSIMFFSLPRHSMPLIIIGRRFAMFGSRRDLEGIVTVVSLL